jgi:hypothetical protein
MWRSHSACRVETHLDTLTECRSQSVGKSPRPRGHPGTHECPSSCEKCRLKVYTDRSHEVFTPTGLVAEAKRVVEGFMYDPTHLHDVLADVLGAAARTINDCPIGVMISATAMDGHNWFFVKDNPRNRRTTGTVSLIDAAVASACAPTYFDHWPIGGIMGQTIRFFDGGAGGTANPAYQVCVEAFEFDGFTPADTRLVALGTGYFPASGDPPKGLLQTIAWTTSTLVDTSEDWVDDAVKRQWPGLMQAFNPLLPSDIDESDLFRHSRGRRGRTTDGGGPRLETDSRRVATFTPGQVAD